MRLSRWSFDTWLVVAFVLIGICWGCALGALHLAGRGTVLDRLEYMTADWRFLLAGPRPTPGEVIIAAIDDATVRQAGGYPLPRDLLARIVRRIAALGPRAIALDILFLDPGRPEADHDLADALRSIWTAVAAVGVFTNEQVSAAEQPRMQADLLADVPSPDSVLGPIAPMADAALPGLVNLSTDHGGVPRFVPMIFAVRGSIVPSFALAVAAGALRAEPVLGDESLTLAGTTIRTDLGYHVPIRYYGPRGSIRQFSAARALDEDLDAGEVRGRVVLIGASAVGLGDYFPTPHDRVVPGVEVLATAITNLLTGDILVRNSHVRRADAVVAILLPCVVVLLMARRRTAIGLVLAVAVVLAWIGVVALSFQWGYWLSVAIPAAAALPVAGGFGLARLLHARSVAGRLSADRAVLTRFHSPRLVEHLLSHPEFLERPVQQDIAVIFVDLSGFTGLAEAIGPAATRELLVEFHAVVERAVIAHDGLVASFMGDGAMILFGVPEPRSDDAARAFRAIAQLDRSLVHWCDGQSSAIRLKARIGGQSGLAIVSRLGPVHHQHITATGDTVNVASRLLEVAKQHGASVVIGEALWTAAGVETQNRVATSMEVAIRGRALPLQVRILR